MENKTLQVANSMMKQLAEMGSNAMKSFLEELEKRRKSLAKIQMDRIFSFADNEGLSLEALEELAMNHTAKLIDEPLVHFLIAAGYADQQGNIYEISDGEHPPTATDVFNEYKKHCSEVGIPHESRRWFLASLHRLGVRAWKRSVTCVALTKRKPTQDVQ